MNARVSWLEFRACRTAVWCVAGGDGNVRHFMSLMMSNPNMDMQNTSVPKLGWSLAEVEVATGLSRATLYRMIAGNELATVKVRGRRLVPGWQAQKLLEGQADTADVSGTVRAQ